MKTILVVDDELGSAEVLMLILKDEGYEAFCAVNGRAGLEKAREVKPDLVVLAGFMRVLKPGFLENVRKTSAFFMEGLKKLQRDSNKITDIRGKGLLIGIDSTVDTKVFIKAAQANGLMTTQAGDSMRLSPPLIITEKEAQEALDILAKTLKESA